MLATDLLATGHELCDPVAVEAVYLREADARINWVTRSGVPAPVADPAPHGEG
jgi:hypothetical protein